MSKYLENLDALAADSTRIGKVRLLRKFFGDPVFRSLVAYALDPYRRYYVRQIPEPESTARRSLTSWSRVMEFLLDPLMTRELSGNAARDAVRMTLEDLTDSDGEMLRRVLRKDLRCGVNSKIANEASPGLVPEFAVQLAAALSEKHLQFPIWGETKIDGMRVLAVVGDGEVEYLSRGGRSVNTMGHLSEALLRMFPDGAVLDGEAVTQGGTFQDSMSAAKRKTARDDAPVSYVVFDMLTPKEFSEGACYRLFSQRRKYLSDLIGPGLAGIELTFGRVLSDKSDVDQMFAETRAAGGEGLVLKDPAGLYEFKRSRAWMKVKASETVDVEISDAWEGTGKHTGRLGALVFHRDGQECRVGTGFSDEQRAELWRRVHSRESPLIGQVMEVEFTELTDGGRTRHARFVRLREHDGERS